MMSGFVKYLLLVVNSNCLWDHRNTFAPSASTSLRKLETRNVWNWDKFVHCHTYFSRPFSGIAKTGARRQWRRQKTPSLLKSSPKNSWLNSIPKLCKTTYVNSNLRSFTIHNSIMVSNAEHLLTSTEPWYYLTNIKTNPTNHRPSFSYLYSQ